MSYGRFQGSQYGAAPTYTANGYTYVFQNDGSIKVQGVPLHKSSYPVGTILKPKQTFWWAVIHQAQAAGKLPAASTRAGAVLAAYVSGLATAQKANSGTWHATAPPAGTTASGFQPSVPGTTAATAAPGTDPTAPTSTGIALPGGMTVSPLVLGIGVLGLAGLAYVAYTHKGGKKSHATP